MTKFYIEFMFYDKAMCGDIQLFRCTRDFPSVVDANIWARGKIPEVLQEAGNEWSSEDSGGVTIRAVPIDDFLKRLEANGVYLSECDASELG